ncbi:MAG: transcriptional regulator MntR [Thaumarchaeota archaeon]|nr:transcriptional regulator MntR [Nitrososphaerota archaeon]
MERAIPLKKETPRLEDYLEAIYHLIDEKGYASSVDISDRLEVKPPTVTSMVKKLAERGYLIHEPYRGMRLTNKGGAIARSVISRHEVISEFLSMIGVEADVAFQDTEGIEHHIQPVTFHRIERLVDFLGRNPAVLNTIREYVERKD